MCGLYRPLGLRCPARTRVPQDPVVVNRPLSKRLNLTSRGTFALFESGFRTSNAPDHEFR